MRPLWKEGSGFRRLGCRQGPTAAGGKQTPLGYLGYARDARHARHARQRTLPGVARGCTPPARGAGPYADVASLRLETPPTRPGWELGTKPCKSPRCTVSPTRHFAGWSPWRSHDPSRGNGHDAPGVGQRWPATADPLR